MSDDQLEAAIEAITAMLAARDQSAGAGADAKVIEGEALPALPPPPESKPNRKRKRSLN